MGHYASEMGTERERSAPEPADKASLRRRWESNYGLSTFYVLHAMVCPTCGALVPGEGKMHHDNWHRLNG